VDESPDHLDASLSRFHRQILLPGIGVEGQRRLLDASVVVIGCGALGSVAAEFLLRAGVGRLELVDRDVVEETNLQRQFLYDEQDAARGRAKAEAARDRLRSIRSAARVRGWIEDLDAESVRSHLADADLVVDGLDNFETRYLLNDACVEAGVPYLYGGAVGTVGLAMTVLPRTVKVGSSRTGRPRGLLHDASRATPCLRCVFPEPPPPGATPTCDTAGVLGTVTAMIAARQATEAIKLLVGAVESVDRGLWSIDPWRNRFERIAIPEAPDAECPCCGLGRFEHLEGERRSETAVLCGRNAVQVKPPRHAAIDLDALAARLASHGSFRREGEVLQGSLSRERSPSGEPVELSVFADGRAIVRGSSEPEFARTIYARFVGT
jgi:molybdopterin/thiamine biosynthesis adenylyltransferase